MKRHVLAIALMCISLLAIIPMASAQEETVQLHNLSINDSNVFEVSTDKAFILANNNTETTMEDLNVVLDGPMAFDAIIYRMDDFNKVSETTGVESATAITVDGKVESYSITLDLRPNRKLGIRLHSQQHEDVKLYQLHVNTYTYEVTSHGALIIQTNESDRTVEDQVVAIDGPMAFDAIIYRMDDFNKVSETTGVESATAITVDGKVESYSITLDLRPNRKLGVLFPNGKTMTTDAPVSQTGSNCISAGTYYVSARQGLVLRNANGGKITVIPYGTQLIAEAGCERVNTSFNGVSGNVATIYLVTNITNVTNVIQPSNTGLVCVGHLAINGQALFNTSNGNDGAAIVRVFPGQNPSVTFPTNGGKCYSFTQSEYDKALSNQWIPNACGLQTGCPVVVKYEYANGVLTNVGSVNHP